MNDDKSVVNSRPANEMTLNQKNWQILRAINKQLNIFQDVDVVEVSKSKRNAKVRESTYAQTKYIGTYSVVPHK